MHCYKSQSEHSVKDGFTKGRQRYKCKECGCHFSVEKKSNVKTEEQRRMAIHMYLEGNSFRAIGRILNISYGTVYQWIKKLGEKVQDIPVYTPSSDGIEHMELDEMHSYIGRKKILLGLDCSRQMSKSICFVCMWE